MRSFLLLATTALLSACGGAGGGGPLSSTPPPQAGPGNGTTTTHSFVHPTEARTYVGIGGVQATDYLTDDRNLRNQQGSTYAGNATTVRNSTIEISYDPRDAIYTLKVADPLSNSSTDTRFQDPASRTDFGGNREPQWGTPNFNNPNIRYLQAGGGNPIAGNYYSGSGVINPGSNTEQPSGEPGSSYTATSLFLLKPGSETQYVTYGGYVRNNFSFNRQTIGGDDLHDVIIQHYERGAFAFGELAPIDSLPKTGTGNFAGSMLATLVFNPTLDGDQGQVLPSYFQWVNGTANLAVDFAASAFNLTLNGTVLAPQLDTYTNPQTSLLAAGTSFNAAGKGTINVKSFGGFKGEFQSARFANPNGGKAYDVNVAGSSIDGAFYGPNSQEVGGGFRIVGGNPDERVDIIGAFTGK